MNRPKMRIASLVACCIPAAVLAAQTSAPLLTAKRSALAQPPVEWAKAASDAGAVDAALPLTSLSIILKRPADRQAAFDELLREQQDPSSPNYHRWLTPVEIGERYGLPQVSIDNVTSWLESQGLHVDAVSNSRVRIRFSGTAENVGNAFAARLHNYSLKDGVRISPSSTPSVPAELAPYVAAVHGLQTIDDKPQMGPESVATGNEQAKSTSCDSNGVCTHYVWPGDFWNIYDMTPAYTGGWNGSGQTVAIIGRSRVNMADIEQFQKRANLQVRDPVEVVPPGGADPGPADATQVDTPNKDQSEATLDVSRVAATAHQATINLVISKSTSTVNGIAIAMQYVVDTNPVPAHVMTISFGNCESNAGASGVAFYDNLFSQAAAEGISVFVSSGDAGVAGCDAHHVAPPAGAQIASPNYICASSHATCVGGTEFADTANPTAYWHQTSTTGFVSAIGYIPEGAWNDPLQSDGTTYIASTGGGVSSYVPTPSWQTGTGVPGRQGRYTPDISFTASQHDPYARCFAASGGSCVADSTGLFHFSTSSGTSASAPSMAGVAAMLNQKMGTPQGNLNPGIYALAASGTSGAFHDVTVATSGVGTCDLGTPSMCNNSVPSLAGLTGGLAGYAVGPGYDLATGLGSLDVYAFLSHWSSVPDTSTASNYQGLWWASPAGSESGWGINFAHQGDTIFATWFTYDSTGAGMWLVMTANKTAANQYGGTLYSTTGPPFSAVPFNSSLVGATNVGAATLTFSDANNGTFAYTVGGISQSKQITRESFGTIPTCGASTTLSSATNYTDLWWNSPAASESGWGINLTHQGTTIFASWFTYDTNGKAMWLVATAVPTGAANTYSGALYRTTGSPFNIFNSSSVVATQVGTATFTFSDGNNASFAYTVNGTSQTKQITREVFGTTATACH
jgi:subtilase family serine protease